MKRTDERDAQKMRVTTAIGQPAADPEEPYAGAQRAGEAAGAQIVVGDIPARRSGFQPRPSLQVKLNQAGQGESAVRILTGIPGTGRTQLAAAYARAKLAAGWRLVAWVSADDTGSTLTGLAAVADAVGLSDASPGWGAAHAGQMVRHWLEADGRHCLLVFDGVQDPDVLRSLLPIGGAARVLITAAEEPVADLGTNVRVNVFSLEEALALLEGRTGLADEAGAAAVATELGCLPLALDLAAAVIARQHQGYVAYLDRLQSLSRQEFLVREEDPQPYPHGVAEAILLSLEVLRADDPTGVCTGMIEIMAVLSAAGVRRELLRAAGEAGALAADGQEVAAAVVDQALAQLAEHALLTFTVDGQTIIVHRLVARVIWDGLTRRERLAAVCREAAVVLEAHAHALAGSENRAAIRDIPGQVTALLDQLPGSVGETDKEFTEVLLRLRFWALYHLMELGDSAAQAIAVGEPLTADLESVLGPDHPDTLNARNSLAAAYQNAGQPAEAVTLFEQTLAARERLLGPYHSDTLTSQNNLAAAYQDAGRPAEAIRLFEQTLVVRERLLGADHPSTLNSMGNLGNAYREAGRDAEAIRLFEQILVVRERLLGADHPSTLNSMGNLGNAYREAGRDAEAIRLFEQILVVRERLLGADHPSTLNSMGNLGNAYREAGRDAEAIRLFEQILVVRERLLGADHPKTLSSRNNLAVAYRDAGRVAEAIRLFEEILAARERLLGAEHASTLITRNNLALAYLEADQPE